MKGKLWLIALISVVILFACKNKKKISLSGEDPVDIADFIESFEPINLPYQIADTSVPKKRKDSVLISYKVFTHLVPDTILNKVFGKGVKPKIYPMGRISAPNESNYLFVKALSSDRKAILIICFDKKNNFITGMPVLQPDANPATQQFFSIDKRYTLSKSIFRKNRDGTISEGKNVYVLNESSKSFMLIMTDALDEQTVELINPIDSFSRKNKYSGDYVKDKLNLVSVRDNKRPGRMTFFVHFERKNNCTGELKGEAGFTSANTAVYRAAGDPCVLQFNFTSSSVTMIEKEGCGSHRGLDCVFGGTYPKKRESKKKELKKSKAIQEK
ncbi:MAG TPA: hypothetical protein VGQ09_20475 [Chitinophagaceae bacterium]|jgi:hypothetical protein|nr:hypothetical protein [Chitinophagaceae bacterium]